MTKTILKKFHLLLLAFVITLSTSVTAFMGTAVAASLPSTSADCTSHGWTFVSGSSTTVGGGTTSTTNGHNFCSTADNAASKNGSKAPSSFACPSGQTLVDVTVVGGNGTFFCVDASKSKNTTQCKSGFAFVLGACIVDPAGYSGLARDACKTYGPGGAKANSAFYDTCLKAFNKGFSGQSQGSTCNNVTGTAKQACQAGWTGGNKNQSGNNTNNNNNNANSNSAPSCEASGFSFSWFLCPLIDGMASSVDWVYTNIIQPLLQTDPINLANPNKDPTNTYKIWSTFRVYGDILLVVALLVVVFGESIGGGLIDAYTAKKVLPRLLIAAVLINLSIYLVSLAVDITNILGNGIMALIEQPFKNAGAFKLHIGGAAGDLGFGALLGATGTIWALVHAGAGGAILEFLAFVIVLPAFLTFLAILVTVILRRGLILFLILVSPIALALFCLPNTEQYFRRWWDLLLKTLLIYPIIAVAFAMGNVLSVTMSSSGGGIITGTLSQLLGVVALIVPLFLIPYSFRIAGGLLGRAHDAVTGIRDRAHKLSEGRRARAQSHLQRQTIQARQQWYSGLQGRASTGNPPGIRGAIRKRGLGALARTVGGYNAEATASAARAEVAKELNDQIATGNDTEIRGLLVNKQAATLENGLKKEVKDNSGNVIGYQYKSLGGAWVNEADVDAGQRRWGRNSFAQQAALSYEMRKADTEEDVQSIATNYGQVAKSMGMTDQQATGAWIGAAFENQDKHLEFKYTDWQTGQLKDPQGLLSEIYEKRGSYNMSQMHAKTIDSIILANRDAGNVLRDNSATQEQKDTAAATQSKAASIAETFMSRYGGAGHFAGEVGESPVERDATGGRAPSYQSNAQGSAHVAERVRQLAAETGVYRDRDNDPRYPPINHQG